MAYDVIEQPGTEYLIVSDRKVTLTRTGDKILADKIAAALNAFDATNPEEGNDNDDTQSQP